jgi:hypothetical protein
MNEQAARIGLSRIFAGRFFSAAAVLIWFATSLNSPAQWLTQSVTLTNGWNGVFLHVDASHTTLEAMVGADSSNPILEVWRWNPASNIQFSDNPQAPIDTATQWSSWVRNSPTDSALVRLVGNSAYLVHVADNGAGYVWRVKGKPVAPVNDWTTTGLNFIGFSTAPAAPPNFESFLSQARELQQSAEVYRYIGGQLGTNNPAPVLALRATDVRRGQAYWVTAGSLFNRYFGPFELDLQGDSGVEFYGGKSSSSVRLINLTPSPLTVTMTLLPSETPPDGQTVIADLPPLLVRGDLNVTNLTYGYSRMPVNTPKSWTLAPRGQSGSEVEFTLGLDRSSISSSPGSFLAGVLRFTDSLGFTQLDAPVSATVGSSSGLWVGRAVVTEVGQYLKSYQRDGNASPMIAVDGRYVVSGINTNLAAVPKPFPLRLIVHNPESGSGAALLQRAFFGLDVNTNSVVATGESVLHPALLNRARRVSATHLPWSARNAPWQFDGLLTSSGEITATVTVDYSDQATNPFLHTYHPDHDNLEAEFARVLPAGSESYTVRRDITLRVRPPPDDFTSLTAAAQTVVGDYLEAITVLGLARGTGEDTRQFVVRGSFTLNRIFDVPILTIAQ